MQSQSQSQSPNKPKETPNIRITDLNTLPHPQALTTLTQIARIEKKTFPTNEAYAFTPDHWKKKPNTRVIFVVDDTTATNDTTKTTNNANASTKKNTPQQPQQQQQQRQQQILAYAVYVRQKSVALLHKLCVAESYRRRGIGRALMDYILRRLEREGCQFVQLWVDRDRVGARALYQRCGFEGREEVGDYYAPGRSGVRMVVGLNVF